MKKRKALNCKCNEGLTVVELNLAKFYYLIFHQQCRKVIHRQLCALLLLRWEEQVYYHECTDKNVGLPNQLAMFLAVVTYHAICQYSLIFLELLLRNCIKMVFT